VRKASRSKDGFILCFAVPSSRVNRKTVSISRPRNNLAVILESRMQDVTVLDQNIISSEWFVSQQGHNVPGVSFPKALYWPSREDGFDMREVLRV